MPFDAWPVDDQDAWDRATSPGTALLDAGPGAHWRHATKVRYRQSYGAWLAFLTAHARLNADTAPAGRVTRDNVLAYIEHLRARDLASGTVATYLQAIHNTLWAIAPETDWSWLKQIVNFLVRNAAPAPIDQTRIHPIDEVYAAALKLMDPQMLDVGQHIVSRNAFCRRRVRIETTARREKSEPRAVGLAIADFCCMSPVRSRAGVQQGRAGRCGAIPSILVFG